MPFVENLEEFKTRQGCECIRGDRGYFFENGARALDNHGFENPPYDQNDLIANKIAFYRTKREDMVRLYNATRNNAVTQAEYYANGWGPAPHPDTAQWLKTKAEEIIQLQVTIDGLLETMPAHIEHVARQLAIEKRRAELMSEGKQKQMELNKLPVF